MGDGEIQALNPQKTLSCKLYYSFHSESSNFQDNHIFLDEVALLKKMPKNYLVENLEYLCFHFLWEEFCALNKYAPNFLSFAIFLLITFTTVLRSVYCFEMQYIAQQRKRFEC